MQRFTVSLEDEVERKLRVEAAGRRVSKSSLAAELIERALTEGEERPLDSARGGSGATAPGAVASTALSPSVSVPDIPGVVRASELPTPAKVDAATGELRGSGPPPKLYARAGCLKKIPMGERCAGCGAVHQP